MEWNRMEWNRMEYKKNIVRRRKGTEAAGDWDLLLSSLQKIRTEEIQ